MKRRMDEARQVRDFWFGRLPLTAAALERRVCFWFSGDVAALSRHDEQIRTRFGALVERATARAFAYDERALALALSGMQSAADAALDVVERIFFYMPMQHAESHEVQDESVAAYRRLRTEAPPELGRTFEATLRSAENHRSIVERFGRFPYRNRLLGRADTPAELEWLHAGGERFGQRSSAGRPKPPRQ